MTSNLIPNMTPDTTPGTTSSETPQITPNTIPTTTATPDPPSHVTLPLHMRDRVLCCDQCKTTLLFPGMIGSFLRPLTDFCSDLQSNPRIIHDNGDGTPFLPPLPTRIIIQLCCSPNTSVVQVDEFLHGMVLSSRYFMRDNRGGEPYGLPSRITEIRAPGSLEMVRRHWDNREWTLAGPEYGVERYLESGIWAVANMECEDPKQEGIRFHCMLLQQMTPKAVILQDLEYMANSMGFGAAAVEDASTIALYLPPTPPEQC